MPKPLLKYHLLIEEVSTSCNCSCPPDGSHNVNIETYRYIFEKDPNGVSHLPGKIKSPKRQFPNAHENCSLCGISCFTDKDMAILNFKNLMAVSPNLYKKIGDSLAYGEIKEDNGIVSEADEKGHFDLFEYETFNPSATFVFLQRLIEDDAAN